VHVVVKAEPESGLKRIFRAISAATTESLRVKSAAEEVVKRLKEDDGLAGMYTFETTHASLGKIITLRPKPKYIHSESVDLYSLARKALVGEERAREAKLLGQEFSWARPREIPGGGGREAFWARPGDVGNHVEDVLKRALPEYPTLPQERQYRMSR
jgi:hypothetical protein